MSITQDVLEYAQAHGEFTTDDVAEVVGVTNTQASGALNALVNRGDVVRLRRGLFVANREPVHSGSVQWAMEKMAEEAAEQAAEVQKVADELTAAIEAVTVSTDQLAEFLAETFQLDDADVKLAITFYQRFRRFSSDEVA